MESQVLWRKNTSKLLGFWLLVWVIQSLLMSGGQDVGFYLLKNLVLVGLQITLVTINWYGLIPWMWQKGYFLAYGVLAVVLVYLAFIVSFPMIDVVFSTFTQIQSDNFGQLIWITDFWRILSGSALYSLAFLCSLVYYLYRDNQNRKDAAPAVSADKIALREGHKTHLIDPQDVFYIEGLKEYVTWNTQQGKIIVLQSLSQIEKTYADAGFLRVHKSFIVNATHVSLVNGSQLRIGAHKIPIGRTYKTAVSTYFRNNSVTS